METSRISSSTSSSKSARATNTNTILSMPVFASSLKGRVESVSNDGLMTISTERGQVKVLSSTSMKAGTAVELTINKDKSEVHVRVINTEFNNLGTKIDPVSNEEPQDKANFLVFKMPPRLKEQLFESVNMYYQVNSASTLPSGGAQPQTNMNIDSRGVIQFLSYIEAGGISDTFGKALKADHNVMNLFPTLKNLPQSLAGFISLLRKGGDNGTLPIKLQNDMNSLQFLSRSLSNTQWDFFMVPINDGQKLLPMKLFCEKKKQLEDVEYSSQRFHVELNMDQLGTIAIDGLMQKKEDRNTLNMVVKSAQSFDTNIMDELKYLFDISNEISGNRGSSIIFQVADLEGKSKLSDAIHSYCKERIQNIIA